MKLDSNQHTIHLNRYSFRTEIHQGVPHIVVPAVLMVEGVHNGNHGPTLHLAEELGKFVASWNGIPVTIRHPKSTDPTGTANTPQTLDNYAVGKVFNAKMDGSKLKAELWIEQGTIANLSAETLAYITEGKPLDVSVGVFSADVAQSGTWRGERYVAVAKDYRPDHLALLPDEEGACNFDDGCGVRVNKKGGESSVKDLFNVFKELSKEGLTVINLNQEGFGFGEIREAIRSKLDAMDNAVKIFFLEEIFDDVFIYRVESREDGAGPSVLLKRGYQINQDGVATFTGDPIPVVRKIEYTEKQTSTFSRMKGVKMADGKEVTTNQQGECAEKVEAMLNKREEKKKEEEKVKEHAKKEKELEDLKGSLSESDKALEALSGEAKERLEYGIKAHKEEKDAIIEKVLAVNSEAYSKQELESKSLEDLQKLSSLLSADEDGNKDKAKIFTGQGAGDNSTISTQSKSGSGGMLIPVGVGSEEEKKGA